MTLGCSRAATSAVIVSALFGVANAVPNAAQELPKLTPEAVRSGVVRVVVQRREGNKPIAPEVGTGFVVVASPEIRILTARHLLYPKATETWQAGDVDVFFYFDRQKAYPSVAVANDDAEHDAILLTLKNPPPPALLGQLVQLPMRRADVREDERLFIVQADQVDWRRVPNAVINLRHQAQLSHFEYTPTSLGDGFSGGPILDGDNLVVGMHLEMAEQQRYGIGVRVSRIVETMNTIGHHLPAAASDVVSGVASVRYKGPVRFRYGANQYVSDRAPFTLSNVPVDWSLDIGQHNELSGYWICRTIERKCWQTPTPSGGELRRWNEDNAARGNPEDQELFLFETVDAGAGTVKVKNVRGCYVTYSGKTFRCDMDWSKAAVFALEFP